MQKRKVYRIVYNGGSDRINKVIETYEEVKNETFVQRNLHWIVVVIGAGLAVWLLCL